MRQGQDAMEIGNIEEISETRVDPAHPGEGLALGTVAIATRVVPHDLRSTLVALRYVASQGRRAARRDGLHHPQLLAGEAMGGARGLAVGTEDIGNFGSTPGAGLGVGVVTPGTTDALVGHQCVDGAHEVSLIAPAHTAR